MAMLTAIELRKPAPRSPWMAFKYPSVCRIRPAVKIRKNHLAMTISGSVITNSSAQIRNGRIFSKSFKWALKNKSIG